MRPKAAFLAAALAILAFGWGPAADAGAPPKNKAPVVNITAPPNGSVFPSGTLVTFTGTASDNEDGDLTGAISWSSSVDGQLGTGGSVAAVLSAGLHTITASVTDSDGKSDSANINITVQAVLAITAVDIVAPAAPSATPQYDKVELRVTLSGVSSTKLYEPDPALGGIDLGATFTSPTSKAWAIKGFYDGAEWRIRFAPDETGAWQFSVSVADSGGSANWGPGTFTCVASSHPGWPRIQGRYLKFTGGTVAYAIGHNTGWQDGPEGVEQPSLAEMASRGENLLSFWLAAPWDLPSWGPERAARAAIENIEQGIGNYNQDACAYLDAVVARAEAAGVCLLPTIWSHGQLRAATGHPWGAGWWDSNAYSTVCSAAAFFDMGTTDQWRYQQNFFRYLIARWGHSRAVAGWVALCEADGTSAYVSNPSQIDAWSVAVAGYFRTEDAFRGAGGLYALTCSKTDYAAGAASWDPGVDLRSMDSYTKEGDDIAVAGTIASQALTMGSGGEPCLHAEFGGNEASGATQPTHLHNGIWAGGSAGAAISPLVWCDGGNFPMLTTAMQRHLEIQAEFMAGINYLADGPTSGVIGVTGSCLGWVTKTSSRGFAWVQSTQAGVPVDGQTVTISGVATGSYTVRWYDVWTSGAVPAASSTVTVAGGNLVVTIPALGAPDVALKFAPDTAPPTNIPVAEDDAYEVAENGTLVVPALTGVLANDADADDDTLTAALSREPANGSVTLNADGSFTYTPNPGFSGEDEFAYKANDGTFDSLVALAVITVTGINDPPIAADDAAATDQGVAVTIPVLDNDTDPDPGDVLSVTNVTQGTNGSVVINGDNTVTYTPDSGFVGTDVFAYEVSDIAGATDTAIVTVTVTGIVPSISGTITSQATGSGMEGIEVTLERPRNKKIWDTVATTTTNAEGYYHFDELEAGTYRVTPTTATYDYDPPSWTVELTGPDDHAICNFEAY